MEIHGYDFTSAPSRRKPITQAYCELNDSVLSVRELRRHTSFDAFEAALAVPGPWVAAIDFPFGQPSKLIKNLCWPTSWEDYVAVVEELGPSGFVASITAYKQNREVGDQEHRRACDVEAGSISPMKLSFTPVGRMFMRGAPLLRRSPASVLPFRLRDPQRIVLEGYPALVARRWILRRTYKQGTKRKQNEAQMQARSDLVAALRSDALPEYYGVSLNLSDRQADDLITDPTADELDAVLCAIQAAWAFRQCDAGFGIPLRANRLEGWIVDPVLA